MLIPIGYQFEADMLRKLRAKSKAAAAEEDSDVAELVSVEELVAAFQRNINTPPLNISREYHKNQFVAGDDRKHRDSHFRLSPPKILVASDFECQGLWFLYILQFQFVSEEFFIISLLAILG